MVFDLIMLALLVILASGAGTLSGFGTSTIMVPIMLWFLPLPETLLFVGVIHWFGDLWKVLLFQKGLRWRLITLFGFPGLVAAWLGAKVVLDIPEELLSRVLGAFFLLYAAFLFTHHRFTLRAKTSTAITGGVLSGFIAGIFGVGGAVRGAFLSAFNLPKAVYIATAGAIGIVVDSVRLTTYIASGIRLSDFYLFGFLLFIPASFLGAELAKHLGDHIPQHYFRTVVLGFLVLVGLKFFLWP